MKKFKKIIFLFLFLVITASGFLFFYKEDLEITRAGLGQNVFGFAWSENIGWLSFNSTNCDSVAPIGQSDGLVPGCPPAGTPINQYGVNLDLNISKEFFGYAWSENIGWISFEPADLEGGATWDSCPLPPCRARYNSGSGEVSGWARACAGTVVNGDCQSATRSDGWDGWISLSGTATDGSTYGVKLNNVSNEFEGWAWGSDVVGWISFNRINCDTDIDGFSNGGLGCPAVGQPIGNYKVKIFNTPPNNPSNLQVNVADQCLAPLGYILSWTFTDPDPGDFQGAYQVRVTKGGNIVVDSCVPAPGSCLQGNNSNSYVPPASLLVYNENYQWQVRVWDSRDAISGWVGGNPFSTPTHAYPQPDFIFEPAKPNVGEVVSFCSTALGFCLTDLSKCYNNALGDGLNLIPCSGETFTWTIPADASFATSTFASENPMVMFGSSGDRTVSLTIQDDVGACPISQDIRIRRKFIEIEVSP